MAPPKKAVRKKLHSFWIEPDQARGLKAVHVRDGILPSEQIRRAIDIWLRRKGVSKGGRRKAE
jgi:hypothetical protein